MMTSKRDFQNHPSLLSRGPAKELVCLANQSFVPKRIPPHYQPRLKKIKIMTLASFLVEIWIPRKDLITLLGKKKVAQVSFTRALQVLR